MHSEKTLKRITKAVSSGSIDRLSEKDQDLYLKLAEASDLIRRYGPTKAANLIRNKYEVTVNTSWHMITSAQSLFGSMKADQKEFWKHFALDKLVTAINYATNQIEENTKIDDDGNEEVNTKAIDPRVLSTLPKLIKELRETIGYAKGEDDARRWEGFEPHIILMSGDPRDAGVEPIEDRDKVIDQILKKSDARLDAQDAEVID